MPVTEREKKMAQALDATASRIKAGGYPSVSAAEADLVKALADIDAQAMKDRKGFEEDRP